MPRAARWARNGSLMHSAIVATTTARLPVASAASASASAATYQELGSLSAEGGASRISMVASCGPSSTAVNVFAMAVRLPHMNVW